MAKYLVCAILVEEGVDPALLTSLIVELDQTVVVLNQLETTPEGLLRLAARPIAD